MSSPKRVVLVGAGGRMGQIADGWITKAEGLTIVARIGSGEDLPDSLQNVNADIGLDFTVAGLGAAHARAFLERGLHAVIGTSGVAPSEDAPLHDLALAKSRGCWIVPNFSVGACAQEWIAAQIGHRFPGATIREEHHETKVDQPSGTALAMQRVLSATGHGKVPIHSSRLPGVIANQEVALAAPGEVLRLVHETYDRSAFGPGIEWVVREVSRVTGLRRGLADALFGGPIGARAGDSPPGP